MMSLHVGLRRTVAPVAIVGYSGMLVMPPNDEPRETVEARSSRARRCCWSTAIRTN